MISTKHSRIYRILTTNSDLERLERLHRVLEKKFTWLNSLKTVQNKFNTDRLHYKNHQFRIITLKEIKNKYSRQP